MTLGRRKFLIWAGLGWVGFGRQARAQTQTTVPLRLGLLAFGSGAWELETMRRHGLDRRAGLDILTTPTASPAAGEIALQAGAVDVIITDWLWVARQRHAGQSIRFIPHSSALGEVMVSASSPIQTLADLKGRRLGIAGGPLDKSWLLLRAYSRRHLGGDLQDDAQLVHASPPLLSQELQAGRVDAIVTFWPFAARLAAQGGTRTLAGLDMIMAGLGFAPPVPLMGFGVHDRFASTQPQAIAAFAAAMGQAGDILAGSDQAWQAIRSLTGDADDATLTGLRSRMAQGRITPNPDMAIQANALFSLLGQLGGAELTGGATAIPDGTFLFPRP